MDWRRSNSGSEARQTFVGLQVRNGASTKGIAAAMEKGGGRKVYFGHSIDTNC